MAICVFRLPMQKRAEAFLSEWLNGAEWQDTRRAFHSRLTLHLPLRVLEPGARTYLAASGHSHPPAWLGSLAWQPGAVIAGCVGEPPAPALSLPRAAGCGSTDTTPATPATPGGLRRNYYAMRACTTTFRIVAQFVYVADQIELAAGVRCARPVCCRAAAATVFGSKLTHLSRSPLGDLPCGSPYESRRQ